MLDILKSMGFAIMMVPVVMVVILGLIYGFGELFNFISTIGHSKERRS